MDYYELLGVSHSADAAEIQAAYLKLARIHHPDVNRGKEAEAAATFKQIGEAFSVLSDPTKRSQYDVQGYVGRRPPGTPPKPKPASKKTKTKEDFERESKAGSPNSEIDLSTIQCSFFGGTGTGQNVLVHLKLNESEMKRGCSKFVKIKKRDLCKLCVGDGRSMKSCPVCGGRRNEVAYCVKCEGVGGIETVCPVCKGEGVHQWYGTEVKVVVPPNTLPGYSVTILGAGEPAPRKAPGNVRVVII